MTGPRRSGSLTRVRLEDLHDTAASRALREHVSFCAADVPGSAYSCDPSYPLLRAVHSCPSGWDLLKLALEAHDAEERRRQDSEDIAGRLEREAERRVREMDRMSDEFARRARGLSELAAELKTPAPQNPAASSIPPAWVREVLEDGE